MMTEVRNFLASMASAGIDLPEREAAEALWLAIHMSGATASATGAARGGQATTAGPARTSTSPSTAASAAAKGSRASAPGVPIMHRSARDGIGGYSEHDVLPIRLSVPRELRRQLELQRALRPLKRAVTSRTDADLDEQTTAESSADAGSIVPVFVPATERWLSLALIVDASPSMILWEELAKELH